MAYRNKVKSSPSTLVDQAIGLKDINIGVNTNRTYGGSPYTGWYNTFDVPTSAPESIVMYKANSPVEGVIKPDGSWEHNFSGDLIPLNLGGSWTIECWVFFPVANFDCRIITFNTPGGIFDFGFDVIGRTKFTYDGSAVIGSTVSVGTSGWAHVAITRKEQSEQVDLYINGNNVGSANFSFNSLPSIGDVVFFNNTQLGTFYFTNLRVVTQTAIYPTESLVATYPQYPLNRSYDDTAVLILGKKAHNFAKDYSLNNVTFDFRGSPFLETEISNPLLKIIDATKVSVSPWNITNISNGLLELIDGHPSRFGQPYFSNVDNAVDWAFNISTDPFMFSNISYEETDGGNPYFRSCDMFLDSGNISSYPIVGLNHFNLRKYNLFGQVDLRPVVYQTTYGGRLHSAKADGVRIPLLYNGIADLSARSFIYYGVLGIAETFSSPHDIVGFYEGNHNWRVERTSATQARFIVTDGSGNENTLAVFNITDTEFPTPYFGLLVSYDDSNGNWVVYVNGQNVANGNDPLGRAGGAGGSVFIWGRATNIEMYHYTSAVWAQGENHVTFALSMGDALSSRYTGIV